MATFGKLQVDPEEKDTASVATPKPQHKLVPAMTISGLAAEVFSVRFSPDGKYLAAGCGDGSIRVFNAKTGALSQTLTSEAAANLPATIVRWRPAGSRTKNVLLSGTAAGALEHWHVTSGKLLHSYQDGDNQFYGMDYAPSGDRFAAAGKDSAVKIYDEDTRAEIASLRGGSGYGSRSAPGHSNRVFSLKWHTSEPDMVVSGGWDNTVQIWDVRAGVSVRTIHGPHLCGDSLDVSGSLVLTGSWRPEDQLQVWDFASGKLVETIEWSSSLLQQREPCMVYAAQFSPATASGGAAEFVAGGGSGANEARVFDRSRGGHALVGTVAGLARGVFTLDFAPCGRRLAVGGGDSTIRIIDIKGSDAWELERPGTAG